MSNLAFFLRALNWHQTHNLLFLRQALFPIVLNIIRARSFVTIKVGDEEQENWVTIKSMRYSSALLLLF